MLCLFAKFRRTWGRPCLFALGYFLVALLPILGFLNISFMRYSLVADHWQYTALIGVVALAAGWLAWVMEQSGGWRTVAMAVAGALVLACALLTFRQTLIYHDEETLWRDTLAKNPKAWVAYGNLGGLLVKKAMAMPPGADSAALLDEAGRCCEEALRDMDQALAPKSYYAETYANRGIIYGAVNRYAEAIRDLDRAIALQPGNAEMYVNRGDIHAAANCYAEAICDYDQAIALQPDDAKVWFNRGTIYAKTGHADEALRDLDWAIALQPNYARAYCNRGSIHAAAQRYTEAIADYTRAIEINPGYAAAYLNRAVAYYTVKDYPRALSDARAAQRLGRPPNPDFLRALAEAAGQSNSPFSPPP
jgi:tetratricopeptide (TPR) repeat protein